MEDPVVEEVKMFTKGMAKFLYVGLFAVGVGIILVVMKVFFEVFFIEFTEGWNP